MLKFSPAAKISFATDVIEVVEGFSTYWFVVLSNSTKAQYPGTVS